MGKIKPTLSLTANASGASSEPGPLSIALTLSATKTLDVDNVTSKIVTFASDASNTIIWDGDAIAGADGAGGTRGGYLYFVNTSAAAMIYIGIDHDDGASLDLSTDDEGDDEAGLSQMRLFTLKPSEFAWMPFDGNCDIFGDSSAAGTLECWYFDRA